MCVRGTKDKFEFRETEKVSLSVRLGNKQESSDYDCCEHCVLRTEKGPLTKATTMNLLNFALALAALVLLLCSGSSKANDNAGSEDMGQDDLSSQDPSIVNPTNKQGYGKDVPTQLVPKKGQNAKKKDPAQQTKTIAEQTIQAALQFGVLVLLLLFDNLEGGSR